MRIISWNVNGLRAVLKKNFREFVKEYSPDVLCLQETKISYDILGELDLPFKFCAFNCAEKKGYSGTAILSNIEPLSAGGVDLEGHPLEGRIVRANFGEINLASVYVPNSQDGLKRLPYRRRWNKDFSEFAKNMPNAVICGDLNVAHEEIDIARPDTNHFSASFTDEEREDFSAMLKAADLSDIWRERNPDAAEKYSWWSYRFGARQKNIGWRIDYFLVRRALSKKVKAAEILDKVEGSDHCPVMIEI